MSRSVNKAILIGNLGADPEVRTTSGGSRVATLSVATNRRWTDKSGATQEKTEWHRVVAWSALAEIAEKYLRKGDRVYIEGRIEYRQWQGQDGQTKYTTEINAREMVMLGGRGEGASGDSYATRSVPATGGGEESYDQDVAPESLEEDDDLPF
jgi:single-strand DNA-binding protein